MILICFPPLDAHDVLSLSIMNWRLRLSFCFSSCEGIGSALSADDDEMDMDKK